MIAAAILANLQAHDSGDDDARGPSQEGECPEELDELIVVWNAQLHRAGLVPGLIERPGREQAQGDGSSSGGRRHRVDPAEARADVEDVESEEE